MQMDRKTILQLHICSTAKIFRVGFAFRWIYGIRMLQFIFLPLLQENFNILITLNSWILCNKALFYVKERNFPTLTEIRVVKLQKVVRQTIFRSYNFLLVRRTTLYSWVALFTTFQEQLFVVRLLLLVVHWTNLFFSLWNNSWVVRLY